METIQTSSYFLWNTLHTYLSNNNIHPWMAVFLCRGYTAPRLPRTAEWHKILHTFYPPFSLFLSHKISPLQLYSPCLSIKNQISVNSTTLVESCEELMCTRWVPTTNKRGCPNLISQHVPLRPLLYLHIFPTTPRYQTPTTTRSHILANVRASIVVCL